MKLDSYIKEYLIQNNNVIVKGFGSFEKVLESAVIDEKSGEIRPPHMTIKFDDTLKIDSGALSKFIAGKEKKSEQEVIKQIIEDVNAWDIDLKAGKIINLNGIGIISQDKARRRKFEAKIISGDFPDMYGLPILSIDEPIKQQQKIQQDTDKKNRENKKLIEKKLTEKKKEAITKPLTMQQKLAAQKLKKPVKQTKKIGESNKQTKKLVVAALIIVPVIVIVVLGALNFDFVKENFNNSSEYVSGLLSSNPEDTINDIEIDTNQLANTNELDSTQNQTESVLENYTIINAKTNESVPAKTEDLFGFSKVEIIAGSFRRKYNAKRLKNELNNKGFTSKVLPRASGLYRVSVGSYDDVNQAAVAIGNIQELDANLNVWILLNK